MYSALVPQRMRVESFDRTRFDEACADLMQRACREERPDALIGIPTGGLYVAEAMARTVDGSIPVLPITCRRPSTRHKARLGGMKKLIAKLPRPILDQLRILEHAILTRPTNGALPAGYQLDEAEIENLRAWAATSGPRPYFLVVDDAVDTGTTLALVLDTVRRCAPRDATIRSAVITVSTAKPRLQPNYTLYRGQLCRFPWSLDAQQPSSL